MSTFGMIYVATIRGKKYYDCTQTTVSTPITSLYDVINGCSSTSGHNMETKKNKKKNTNK